SGRTPARSTADATIACMPSQRTLPGSNLDTRSLVRSRLPCRFLGSLITCLPSFLGPHKLAGPTAGPWVRGLTSPCSAARGGIVVAGVEPPLAARPRPQVGSGRLARPAVVVLKEQAGARGRHESGCRFRHGLRRQRRHGRAEGTQPEA